MEKEIILYENLVEIDLLKEFWDYQKKCRESLYHLKSLKIALESVIVVDRPEEDVNKVKENINKLHSKCEVMITKYESHEKLFYNYSEKDKEAFSEVAIATDEDNFTHLKGNEILESIKTAISLKSDMDKLQIDILNLLIDESNHTIHNTIKRFKNLEIQFLSEKNKRLLYIRTNHSVDEDKIVTYKISTSNTKAKKDFAMEKMQFPQFVKRKDYTYILKYKREEYRGVDNLIIEYIGLMQKEKVYINEKRKTNLQLFFNIIITISTITTLVINILKFIYNK